MTNEEFKIDFLGIGVCRAGTTWIYRCLQEHPEICAPKEKELHFLNDPNKYRQGLAPYVSYFSHCKIGQIKGEYTPGYMARPEFGHEFVKKYFPEVKFIVCLRNPIERAYSHYFFHKNTEEATAKTFEGAIRGELKFYYINLGFYYSQLKKFFDLYPKENFLILIYEDIAKNPVKFIQGIYKFLGVDSNFIPPSARQEINWTPSNPFKIPFLFLTITKIKRCFFHRPKLFKPVVFLLKLFKMRELTDYIIDANSRREGRKRALKSPMNEETRKYLRGIYQEDIKNLEKLISRDLSFWQ